MEGELQRTLGENVCVYRTARGMSQEALAHSLGFHRTYVGAIERGEKNLTLRTIERLAERLDVDPLTLLQLPASPPPPGETQRRADQA